MNPIASDLIAQIKLYNPEVDSTQIEKAVEYARVMHGEQTRSSGEPYYTHPVEVAGILAELKMDLATIVTAILHDTLEDTKATYEDLEKKFSPEVASLVNGVSKLTKIE
ncbi:MAG: HD domain-containing protein, partial [Pseudomonadota bacterium]